MVNTSSINLLQIKIKYITNIRKCEGEMKEVTKLIRRELIIQRNLIPNKNIMNLAHAISSVDASG
jgi:hypothetical protein